MPIHRIPRAHAHEDLADIQHQGEVIAAVVVEGDMFVVFTNFPSGDREPMERRLAPLAHTTRLGVPA